MNKSVEPQLAGAPLPQWPAPEGARVIFLTESRTATERQVLERWIEATRPAGTKANAVFFLGLPSTGDELRSFANQLAPHLSYEATLLAPLRVVWLPREKGGERSARISDLVLLRNPRKPRESDQKRIMQLEPERFRVVAGQPASIGDLNARAKRADDADASDAQAFAEFVSRQARLALERAEYRLIGRRYKLPRLVREQIAASRRFRDGVAEVAKRLKRSDASVMKEALIYLQELRTAHSPYAIDLMMQVARGLFSRGYGAQIDYDQAQIERTRAALERAPGIILPSHKSNLDSAVTSVAFADNRLATPTTFGGINMAFWPLGTVARKAGRVFIRRDIKNNPVYKFVLREYLGYLVEKRFSLEWYIEGGRSRTGKLLPPKLGLLTYLVSAYREGRVEDLMLMPISIAYDQLHEVSEFAAEAKFVAPVRTVVLLDVPCDYCNFCRDVDVCREVAGTGTGEPLHGQVETIERHDGTRAWFVTSKSRLLVADSNNVGVPVGITSMSVDLRAPETFMGGSAQSGLVSALDYLHGHLHDRLTIDDLARVADLSREVLDRTCRRSLGGSVGQIITRVRIDRAMHLLSHSNSPIGDVAQSCGFYDQSDFTRRFRSVTGRTPTAYRSQHPVHGLKVPRDGSG